MSRILLGFDPGKRRDQPARVASNARIERQRRARPLRRDTRFEVAIGAPACPEVLARRVGGEVAERVRSCAAASGLASTVGAATGGGRGEDGGESIEEAHGQILRERSEEAPISEAVRGPRIMEHVDELRELVDTIIPRVTLGHLGGSRSLASRGDRCRRSQSHVMRAKEEEGTKQ